MLKGVVAHVVIDQNGHSLWTLSSRSRGRIDSRLQMQVHLLFAHLARAFIEDDMVEYKPGEIDGPMGARA